APSRQDPSVVADQIRAEMNQADEDVRFDVRQGVVEPRALASLDADRAEIERDLAEASAKGYFTPDDRAHLEAHVQAIRDLRSQLRRAAEGQTEARFVRCVGLRPASRPLRSGDAGRVLAHALLEAELLLEDRLELGVPAAARRLHDDRDEEPPVEARQQPAGG